MPESLPAATIKNAPTAVRRINVAAAREIVKDLFRPNPWIYWTDFLFHVSLAWGSFFFTLQSPAFSAQQMFFYLVTSLAMYRAVIFIHELAHLKRS